MPADNLEARLQRLVDRQMAKRQIHNIVVGVLSVDGSADAAAAGGYAWADESLPMTTDTSYYLASITKMYTATVAMKLAVSGQLELEAPISAYLNAELIDGIHVIDGISCGDGITVSQLLRQTSGLADYFEGEAGDGASLVDELKDGHDQAIGIEDVVAIVRRLDPAFTPGADSGRRAHYSDTNYALLGSVIEAVTDVPLSDTFQELIFGPLGLSGTYVSGDATATSRPADMYFKDRHVEIPLAMASFAPDGGLVSTLAESLRFLRAFFEGELLTGTQLADMTSQWNRIFFPLQYGCGLMRFAPPRWMSPFQAPPELIGHSGSTGSFAFYDPRREVYLAGTVNQMDSPSRPFKLMAQTINLLD